MLTGVGREDDASGECDAVAVAPTERSTENPGRSEAELGVGDEARSGYSVVLQDGRAEGRLQHVAGGAGESRGLSETRGHRRTQRESGRAWVVDE